MTGGAGMIGSGLIWALNRRGIEHIVVVDRLGTDERWRNLNGLCFADYLDADDFLAGLGTNAIPEFDLVLHLGACSDTTERDAAFLMRNNYEYTKRLALWSLERGVRFVYASSAATYGDGAAGMSDHDQSAAALSKLRPLNGYGYSKHLFDQWAARSGVLDRLVGLKYFNVFGPNENHKAEMRSLVNKAYHQIAEDGRVRLFKSYRPEIRHGEQRRDFLYLKDAVEMTLFLAADSSAHGIYNIGSGVAKSWLDMANALFRSLGREPAIEFIEMPEAIKRNYQYFTRAEISRLRSAGWGGSITSLDDAVQDYVKNYLEPNRRLAD